jgi:hypothetical protein
MGGSIADQQPAYPLCCCDSQQNIWPVDRICVVDFGMSGEQGTAQAGDALRQGFPATVFGIPAGDIGQNRWRCLPGGT